MGRIVRIRALDHKLGRRTTVATFYHVRGPAEARRLAKAFYGTNYLQRHMMELPITEVRMDDGWKAVAEVQGRV